MNTPRFVTSIYIFGFFYSIFDSLKAKTNTGMRSKKKKRKYNVVGTFSELFVVFLTCIRVTAQNRLSRIRRRRANK
jgi:hypothetical protein